MMRHEEQTSWIKQKIPEHALWLSQNRTVTAGDRFLVEGAVDENIVALVVDNELSGEILASLQSSWAVATLVQ